MWSRGERIWPNDSVTVCTLCCCAVNDRAVHVSHSVFGTVEKAWGHLWVVAAPQNTISELPIVTNEEMFIFALEDALKQSNRARSRKASDLMWCPAGRASTGSPTRPRARSDPRDSELK
jgi:hypothetical protein